MKQFMATIQGKKIQPDIQYINKLITDNPSWGRSRLSLELCRQWNWHNHNGQYKDMACRNLLLKLELAGCIVLPERQRKYMGRSHKRSFEFVPHLTEEINGDLKTFGPLQIMSVAQYSDDNDLFNCLVSKYHYLGYRNVAGENIKYLVRAHTGRPLACLLFCSPAWKVQSRDFFIGWDHERREVNLCYENRVLSIVPHKQKGRSFPFSCGRILIFRVRYSDEGLLIKHAWTKPPPIYPGVYLIWGL